MPELGACAGVFSNLFDKIPSTANKKLRSYFQFERLGGFLFRFFTDDFRAQSKDRNFRLEFRTRNPITAEKKCRRHEILVGQDVNPGDEDAEWNEIPSGMIYICETHAIICHF